jgi:hypothetical protein
MSLVTVLFDRVIPETLMSTSITFRVKELINE